MIGVLYYPKSKVHLEFFSIIKVRPEFYSIENAKIRFN